MKKNLVLVLILCLCFCLTACGAAASGTPAQAPAATPAAASEAAPTAAPFRKYVQSRGMAAATAAPQVNYQELVDSLNVEEVAQHTEDDPSVGVFELGKEPNTIVYKFAMHIFQYVILMAESGDQENLNAYNRMIESLPELENSLENALRESFPELNIQVYMMVDEYSGDVTAVVDEGEIIFDGVNGVGTKPLDVKPILTLDDLTPEEQAMLEEMTNSLFTAQ